MGFKTKSFRVLLIFLNKNNETMRYSQGVDHTIIFNKEFNLNPKAKILFISKKD